MLALAKLESHIWVKVASWVHISKHLHLMDLLIHALDLDEALHISSSNSLTLSIDTQALDASKVSLVILSDLIIWSLLIIHIVFEIIKDTIKIDRVQLDWHLRRRILLVMNHWRRLLLLIHLTRLDSVPLVDQDFSSIEDDQVWQLLDYVQSILWLPGHWIIHQAYLH